VIVSELVAVIAIRSEGFAVPNLRATYQVQFNASFRFADAAAIADYLGDLGISHLYCSPYLTLVGGTTAGTMAQRVHNEAFNGARAPGRYSAETISRRSSDSRG
jgi:maltooligosyltrehalose synthase